MYAVCQDGQSTQFLDLHLSALCLHDISCTVGKRTSAGIFQSQPLFLLYNVNILYTHSSVKSKVHLRSISRLFLSMSSVMDQTPTKVQRLFIAFSFLTLLFTILLSLPSIQTHPVSSQFITSVLFFHLTLLYYCCKFSFD